MRTIKLTEQDLEKIVKKVLKEQISVPSVNRGKKGNEVIQIQQELVNKGYNLGTSGPNGNGVDGKFGHVTQNEIKDFQKRMKLNPTGSLDQQTRNYLFSGSVPSIPGVGVKLQQKTNVKKPGTQTTQKKEGSKVETSSAAKKVAKCETGTDQVLISGASLFFDGDKLYWLANGKTIKSWSAVSGLTWKNTPPKQWGEMLKKYTTNREEWSKDKNAGPLPEGTYSVGPLETRGGNQEEIGGLEAFWYKITGQVEDNDSDRAFCKNTILSRISWGNYRAKIVPTGNQKMYGRGDFYVHGGSLRGSHGCIDLTDDMEDFAKFFGVWSSSNNKKTIPLTVKYKNPLLNQIIQKLVNLF
jgi:hypothetical protein